MNLKIEAHKKKCKFLSEMLEHQSDVLTEMYDANRLTIALPTGTGKSRIIYGDIFNKSDIYGLGNFVIASHRLLLNSQHFTECFNIFKWILNKYAFIFVGSGGYDYSELIKNTENLQILGYLQKSFSDCILHAKTTRELTTMTEKLNNEGISVIVITTYHSMIKLKDVKFISLYCDEAHTLATPSQASDFQKSYNKIDALHHYFFTATPKDSAEEYGTESFLMNNEQIFGKRTGLTFREAIERGLIVKPYLHFVRPTEYSNGKKYNTVENYTQIIEDSFLHHKRKLQKDSVAGNQIGCKLLVKCPNVEMIWAIKKRIEELKEFGDGGKIGVYAGASWSDDIGNYMKNTIALGKNQFLDTLKVLKNEDDALLLHYDVLSEGIDVPGITGVMFLSNNLPSKPKILQTIGRATRLHPNDRKNLRKSLITVKNRVNWVKPYCAVILPVVNEITEESNKKIAELVRTMRDRFEFTPEYLVSVGDDTTTGKPRYDDGLDARNQKPKSKALFEWIKEINHEMEKLDEVERKNEILNQIDQLKGENLNDEEYLNAWIKLKERFDDDNEIEEYLFKSLYKSGRIKDSANIYMPQVLRRKMIAKGYENGMKTLVISTLEFLEEMQDLEHVVFYSPCAFKCQMVKKVYPAVKTICAGYNIIKKELKDMKFDLIISNPPYNNGLDIQILNNIYELGNRICMIHPTKWLYNKKPNTFKFYKKAIKKIQNDFVEFEVVKDANRLFGIGLFTDVAITMFEKGKGLIDPSIIDIHGINHLYLSARKKVLNYCQEKNNLLKEVKYTGTNNKILKELEWEVGFSGIRGHINQNDFYTFIQIKDESKHIGRNCIYRNKNAGNIFEFITKEEAENFLDFLKLKVIRFCLSIYKLTQNLNAGSGFGSGEIASVPYMPDYSKPWTDQDVAAEIGLTEEELKWAINWIPNYYPEDEEKYEKWSH